MVTPVVIGTHCIVVYTSALRLLLFFAFVVVVVVLVVFLGFFKDVSCYRVAR